MGIAESKILSIGGCRKWQKCGAKESMKLGSERKSERLNPGKGREC